MCSEKALEAWMLEHYEENVHVKLLYCRYVSITADQEEYPRALMMSCNVNNIMNIKKHSLPFVQGGRKCMYSTNIYIKKNK